MKKYDSNNAGHRTELTQVASKAISGNGDLTPEEFMRQTPGRQSSEPSQAPVSIIIPAYMEQAGVASQIRNVLEVMRSQGMTYEVVVVDDGSEDATTEKAIEAGARVLRKPQNHGYGAAIKTGILAAAYDTIVIIDADGTYPADQIPTIVRK